MDHDLQIAVGAAIATRLPLAAQHDHLAVINAGRNVHIGSALMLFKARTAAARAGLLDHLSCTAAGMARPDRYHETACRAHLAAAIAGLAGLRLSARLGSAAVADITALIASELKRLLRARGRFLKADAQAEAQVIALLGRVARSGSAHAPAKKLVKYVLKPAHLAWIKAEATKPAPAHLRSIHAELVIARALVGIGQHLICFVDLLEALLRRLIVRVQVGVRFLGQLAVGFLDIFLAGSFSDPQHLIIISFCCHSSLLNQGAH